MSPPVQELRERANRLLALLDQGFPLSLGPEERKSIVADAGKVLQKVNSLERNVLRIGLLGGTGVGKSTLMNALAGARIASVSHRRPHTEHVLIYRHNRSSLLPFLQESGVPYSEITHGIDSIERILLCDLPDFDSIEAEHRERVIRFLEHLDLVVWVTSLEKYGDGRFYEFLAQAKKANENFVFVLNKADLLFRDCELKEGYELLERTVSQFRGHLCQSGLETPLLFVLAAEDSPGRQGPAPWNQLPLFTQYVFQQRTMKEIRTIRSANLDVEIQEIFSVLEREALHLKTMEQLLKESLHDLEERRSAWMGDAKEAIASWLRRQWRADLLQRRSSSALVGPGEAVSLLVREVERMGKEKDSGSDSSSPAPPEDVVNLFRAQAEEGVDKIRRRILTHSLPSPILERTESYIHAAVRTQVFEGELARGMAVHGQAPPAPAFRWFRLVQHSLYILLFILFLLALGGRGAWEGIMIHPGWGSVFRLATAWIGTLFSSRGLAALCSYLLLNGLFGFRFYRRHRRMLDKASEKRILRATDFFLDIWERHLRSLQDDLGEFRDDIVEKISIMKR